MSGTGCLTTSVSTSEVASMATKGGADHEEAWRNAKKICHLNARQVEMGRALCMNPKKLPRLRPSPQQRWKLPVGEFIEACYLEAVRRQSPLRSPAQTGAGFGEASDRATGRRAETRQRCGVAGGGSGLLPYESRRRSEGMARTRYGRPGGVAPRDPGTARDRGGS